MITTRDQQNIVFIFPKKLKTKLCLSPIMSDVAVVCQTGSIALDVVYVTPDEDSDDQNVDYEDENGFR